LQGVFAAGDGTDSALTREMRRAMPPAADRSPTPRNRSLRVRLPLLFIALIVAVLGTCIWVSYTQVESALIGAGGARATGAADQVAGLLERSVRQTADTLRQVVATGQLRRYLLDPTDDRRAAARSQLAALASAGTRRVELWAEREVNPIEVVTSPPPRNRPAVSLPAAPRPLTAGVGPFRSGDGAMYYDVVIEIWDEPNGAAPATPVRLGHLVLRSVPAGSSSETLRRLVASEAIVKVGNGSGELWTDLTSVVGAPGVNPPVVGVSDSIAENGERRLGAIVPVSNTPWVVWVGFPRSVIVEPARSFLRRMSALALLMLVVGGVVVAIVSARITRPMRVLAQAAGAIAAGNYSRRVDISRRDEIGQLGDAFNTMSSRMESAKIEREAAELDALEQARHATFMASIAAALTAGESLPGVLGRSVDAMVQYLDAAHASVWIINVREAVLERQAVTGSTSAPFLDADRLDVGTHEVGRIAVTRQPYTSDQIAGDPCVDDQPWVERERLISFAGFPLIVDNTLVGVLTVYARQTLSARTLESLESASRNIAIGVQRKQLEDSRRQLASILDAAPDFVTIGQPNGAPIYINRAARQALGIGDTDQIASLLPYRPAGFRDFFEATILPSATRDGAWTGETEYLATSGRVIPVSQVSVVHKDVNGEVAYVSTISRDITDRQRVERELRESEARFRRIAETITEVFWIADLSSWSLVYISPGYERVWGRTADGLYQHLETFFDFVHADDRARVVAALHGLAPGQSFDLEYRIVRPDGEIRWIWARGFPVANSAGSGAEYVGAAQDITDRKHADDQVRLLARAIESTNEMVSVTDLDDRLTFVNGAFLRSYGYTLDEVLGKTPDLLLATGLEAPTDAQIQAMRGGGWQGEVRHRHRDGSDVTVSLNTSLIRDPDGAVIGRLGVARDITGQRLLEEQLRQSQKMEAIGQLAGGIAHDFNNLLTAIQGYSVLLRDSMEADDERRGDLEEITRAAERAAGLTRQLLAFSRKQILAPSVLRLGDVVSGLLPMLRRLIGESLDLKAVLADRGAVKADTGQLEQVLINLVVNARDAMPDGGHLTIDTQDVVLDEDYVRTHAGAQTGAHVMLAVTDTGHGMDEATRRRAFEPFFTTKPQGQGTGLGLAMVHGIVQQSGGHVWIYSEPGHGTTFKVYFPQTTADGASAIAPPQYQRVLKGTETILLVEDEAVVRDFTHRVLTRAGYSVHAMPTPARAIEFAQAHHGHIDILVTDVVLPGMNGRALADQIVQLHGESKVLFTSGYTDHAIVHQGVLDAGLWFLQKPFTIESLLDKVRDVLENRRARRPDASYV
jgi:two-component system, cell cycle sensor histidine kinase and response regulator CckA